MYCNILTIEEQLFNHEFGKAIPAIIPLVQECGDEHRYLYSQLFYTMIIADYFRNAPVVDKEVEEVIRIADLAMKAQPCQENLLYLAAAMPNGKITNRLMPYWQVCPCLKNPCYHWPYIVT